MPRGITICARTFDRLRREQSGSTIVLAALAMLGMLAMTGLVIDGGTMYITKSRLQKTADAAALSGAQELTQTESSVRAVVGETIGRNGESADTAQTEVTMGDKVRVTLTRQVKLQFAGLFGLDSADIQAVAAAQIQTMGEAGGAAPLGIDDSIPLEYYKAYSLKVDQTEVENGNFGILALGGTGAATYEDNLKYGYQQPLRIGDIIDTQTGNIADKTRQGVQDRIDRCPYPEGDLTERDNTRIILIPVYKPSNYQSGQLKSVEITGFAYFYIAQPMSSQDKAITGMFIKRAGTGIVSPGAVNRGAYVIRLTE